MRPARGMTAAFSTWSMTLAIHLAAAAGSSTAMTSAMAYNARSARGIHRIL